MKEKGKRKFEYSKKPSVFGIPKSHKTFEYKPFILPVVTIVFFIVLFSISPNIMSSFLSETRNSWNSLTGQAVGDNKYLLQGFIEVSVDEDMDRGNCSADVSVLSADEKSYDNLMSLEAFLSKSDKKEDKYSFSLETLGIRLGKGEHDVNFEVFCDGKRISKSSQRITI